MNFHRKFFPLTDFFSNIQYSIPCYTSAARLRALFAVAALSRSCSVLPICCSAVSVGKLWFCLCRIRPNSVRSLRMGLFSLFSLCSCRFSVRSFCLPVRLGLVWPSPSARGFQIVRRSCSILLYPTRLWLLALSEYAGQAPQIGLEYCVAHAYLLDAELTKLYYPRIVAQ